MPCGCRFRFYPTPEQEHILARTFGCVRYVYNWALRLRTDAGQAVAASGGSVGPKRVSTRLGRNRRRKNHPEAFSAS